MTDRYIFSGLRLCAHRLYCGKTQAEIAQATGLPQSAISRLERGKGLKNLGKVAGALNTHPGEFWIKTNTNMQ